MGVSRMYKSDKTTYVVKNIPVELWKNVKSRLLFSSSQHKSIGNLVISLLDKWVKDGKNE
jgi:hypothetical protein